MMIRIRFVCQNNIHGTKSENHNSYSSIDNNKGHTRTDAGNKNNSCVQIIRGIYGNDIIGDIIQ